MFNQILVPFVVLLALVPFIGAVELTFELPDSAEQCFYEEITRGIKSTIEYQVSFSIPATGFLGWNPIWQCGSRRRRPKMTDAISKFKRGGLMRTI